MANDHSIAWGIAQALHDAGAEVGFSSIEMLIDKRVQPLADSIGSTFVEPCDVQNDADIERVFARWQRETQDRLDILVHALAFAKREDLDGRFVDTSRDGFALALDVSRLFARGADRGPPCPMIRRGSILTLSYYGAEKVVANYNVMGVAKAALEATRPLHGRRSRAGRHPRQRDQRRSDPDARGERGSRASRRCTASSATSRPLRRNVTIEDVGATALYLASDLSSAVTGEMIYVDGGLQHPRRAHGRGIAHGRDAALVAPSEPRQPRRRLGIHPVILFWVLIAAGVRGRGDLEGPLLVLAMLIGVLLIALGAWLMFRGIRDLRESVTPMPKPKPDGQLVIDGIYAYVRHPIYIGMMLVAFGLEVAMDSLCALIVAADLHVVFHRPQVPARGGLAARALPRLRSLLQAPTKRFVPYVY